MLISMLMQAALYIRPHEIDQPEKVEAYCVELARSTNVEQKNAQEARKLLHGETVPQSLRLISYCSAYRKGGREELAAVMSGKTPVHFRKLNNSGDSEYGEWAIQNNAARCGFTRRLVGGGQLQADITLPSKSMTVTVLSPTWKFDDDLKNTTISYRFGVQDSTTTSSKTWKSSNTDKPLDGIVISWTEHELAMLMIANNLNIKPAGLSEFDIPLAMPQPVKSELIKCFGQ